jgi:hypothetical protein
MYLLEHTGCTLRYISPAGRLADVYASGVSLDNVYAGVLHSERFINIDFKNGLTEKP